MVSTVQCLTADLMKYSFQMVDVRSALSGLDQFTTDSTAELRFVESMMSFKKMEVANGQMSSWIL